MTDPSMFDKILRGVRNPSEYLGTELNSIHKDPAKTACSIALAFPDLYAIGSSHLGLKILYGVVNAHPDLCAERVFAPGEDFAAAITQRGMKLTSLETRRPLGQFDLLGFTIPYELSYTTILWMLDLAGIPLRAADRGEGDPLVIGGGAGVYNPEPVAPFFDLFFLGEAEGLLPEIMRAGTRKTGKSRSERLRDMAALDGVYVPSHFKVEYLPGGSIASIHSGAQSMDKPKRVFIKSLGDSPYPFKMPVPFGKPAHDRLNVEIDRGCVQGCRFCQAGTTYRPARERTPEQTLEIFGKALPATGYGDISLTSLSAGDYSRMDRLLGMLMDRYSGGRVAVSLPSLRPGSVTANTVEQIKRVRRTGFTITAEAGTQRLRNVINKKVTDEQIQTLASTLLENGWRSLKLYFMIGLPTETDEDVDAIAALAVRLLALRSSGGGSYTNLTVSVSNFVPKAHTAFQWEPQDPIESLERKKERLFRLIRPHKRIKLKWTDPRVSALEGTFARGDRRLADVVERAYRLGTRLDPWSERRNMDAWREAFGGAGLAQEWYANRRIPLEEILPWSHLDTGLSPEYFLGEHELAQKGEITGDCKVSKCLLCGLDPKTCFKPEKEAPPAQAPLPPLSTIPEARFRYRLTYHKKETGKFHGHLETMAIIARAFRAAGLPVAHSEGFHPQPRISYGPALPVGVESAQEALDVELTSYHEPWSISVKLNAKLPEGFHFVDAAQIGRDIRPVSASTTGFTFRVKLENPPPKEKVEEAVAGLLAASSAIVAKEGRKAKDLRPLITSLTLDKESLDVVYQTRFSQEEGFARPDDVVKLMFPDGSVGPARMVKLSADLE